MPIELIDLYAWYRKRDYVLKSVNIKISNNTVILGPNGSGKTTLIRSILGFVVSKKGRVFIDGINVDSITSTTRLIATNLREVIINSKQSVESVVKFMLKLIDGDYEYFTDIIMRFTGRDILKKNFAELSEGQKKIVLNALALASRAKYIVLDEPFEGLDPAKRVAMLNEIQKANGVKIISTHVTWMLKNLPDWDLYLVVEGCVYGPLRVSELEELKISSKPVKDAVLTTKLKSGSQVYLSKTTGIPLSSLDTLDKLYEVIS